MTSHSAQSTGNLDGTSRRGTVPMTTCDIGRLPSAVLTEVCFQTVSYASHILARRPTKVHPNCDVLQHVHVTAMCFPTFRGEDHFRFCVAILSISNVPLLASATARDTSPV